MWSPFCLNNSMNSPWLSIRLGVKVLGCDKVTQVGVGIAIMSAIQELCCSFILMDDGSLGASTVYSLNGNLQDSTKIQIK